VKSLVWFLTLLFLVFIHPIANAEVVCTPLKTPIKYKLQKGEFIAAVLRKFKLEPVFGKNKSLDQTLALNQIKDANTVEPGAELFLPFQCESDAEKWTLTEATGTGAETPKFRWITTVMTTQTEIKKQIDTIEAVTPVGVVAPIALATGAAATGVSTAATTAAPTAPPVKSSKAWGKENAPKTELLPTDNMDARLKEVLGVKPVDPNAPKPEQKDIEQQKGEAPPEVSEALRYRMICEGEWVGDQCISRYSILHASVAGWFNRYDGLDPTVATNNRGVLLTKLNPEFMFGWENYWLPNVKTLLNASFMYSELLPEAREIPIDQKKNLLSSFMGEVRYENANWGVGLGIAQREKLFYRFRFSGLSQPCLGGGAGFTGCGVTANAASITNYFVTANWIFYQAGKFTNDLTASLIYLGASETAGWTIEAGTGWWLEYRVKHDRVQEYLWGALRYGYQSQSTSIERQDATELGFTFGYAWKLKDW